MEDKKNTTTDRKQMPDARKSFSAPSTKIIMGLCVIVVAGIMGYGMLDRMNLFGLGKKPQTAQMGQTELEGNKTIAKLEVPIDLGGTDKEAITGTKICPNQMRVPEGMRCPEMTQVPKVDKVATVQSSGGDGQVEGQGYYASGAQNVEKKIEPDKRFSKGLSGSNGKNTGAEIDARQAEAAIDVQRTNSVVSVIPIVSTGASAVTARLNAAANNVVVAQRGRSMDFLLTKGTLPDCVLNNAIKSTQPGFIRCTLSLPVYSANARVVLMEAGTVVDGEYSGAVEGGQANLFAVWSRARTPNGVILDLKSPAADSLGRSGMTGYVNSKFFERFAGVLFYSAIQDVIDRRVRANKQGSGGGVTINASTSGTSEIAKEIVSELLTQGKLAQPEFTKKQGETIKIHIANDVDFSNVYQLAVR